MSAPQKLVKPWIWGLLYLPFGCTSGFVSVTMVWILSNVGKLDDETVSALVAMNLLPHTWKFFWSPIADVTLTRKTWYILSNLASSITIGVIAFTPITKDSLDLLKILIFVNSLAITVLGMAVEGIMAHATPPEERGRAAGWFQAGNLGGSGIGGGIALLLAQHISTEVAFLTIAISLASLTLLLRLVPEAPRLVPLEGSFFSRFNKALIEVVRELWQMIATRRGFIAVFLVFLPIGSAAASGLFSAMSESWGASAELVAIVTGLVGGTVSIPGCIFGGWLSDRYGRRTSYIMGGLFLAAVAALMALLPRNEVTFTVCVLLYQFGSGIAYGTFTGFVLSVIGHGAVATKYNALASLSNVPIWYMTLVIGWASTAVSRVFALCVDGLSEIAGILILLLLVWIVKPGKDETK